jgi:hypothetical protein
MNPMMKEHEIVRELLDYDPRTGNLIWKSRNDNQFNSRFAGKIAGFTTQVGYWAIGINLGCGFKVYQAHRLVWLHQTGEWPHHHIDHLDRDKLNNRIENLADVTPSKNNQNKSHRVGKSGVKGVHWSEKLKKWNAQANHNGKKFHFGFFDTIEEATVAYNTGVSSLSPDEKSSQKTKAKNRNDAPKLTQERLKEQYHYDTVTGFFYRKYKNRIETIPAGYCSTDYRRLSVDAVRYQAHHLAILYVTGSFPDPDKDVDHIDQNKDNNAFTNLRQVSKSLNCMNRKSKNGEMRGVRRSRNKREGWEARLRIGSKLHQIGTFDTQEEAKAAWLKFARDHHGDDWQ